MNATKVIFRPFSAPGGGSPIALFPEHPGTSDPDTCMSYMRTGQHGSASVWLSGKTRPATPEEIAPLKRELEIMGYALAPVPRFHPSYRRTRLAQLNHTYA